MSNGSVVGVGSSFEVASSTTPGSFLCSSKDAKIESLEIYLLSVMTGAEAQGACEKGSEGVEGELCMVGMRAISGCRDTS